MLEMTMEWIWDRVRAHLEVYAGGLATTYIMALGDLALLFAACFAVATAWSWLGQVARSTFRGWR
jgi:hypothetical protein